MDFLVTNSFIEYRAGIENNGLSTMLFHVINDKKRHKLCIGKKFIFTEDGFDGDGREQVQGRISLIPCDDLKQKDGILSKESIGRVSFFEESVDEFSLYHEPHMIWFDVYISSKLFNEIRDNLRYKSNSIKICLNIEGLTWGREPDNTHQIWGLLPTEGTETQDPQSLANLDVVDFRITFNH